MDTQKNKLDWTNEKLNPTHSETVKIFFEALKEGREEDAFEVLNDDEIFIVSKAYIEGLRETSTRLSQALKEVKSDRDTLLKTIQTLWINMGFLYKVFTTSSPDNLSGGKVKLTGVFLRNVLGLKDLKNEMIANIYHGMEVAKKQYPVLVSNFAKSGEQMKSSLAILMKYKIIKEDELPKNLLPTLPTQNIIENGEG